MLELKELVKIYKPKKGVPVTAIDNVSLKFPDKGMVFLLGKSGSGKSTLLNLLGGLDNYNSGEIIIKGVSSKNFKQKHFDSYRNTYVGFIFQEYNVLDEFTVGANIALAIELQNRKATDEEINEILKEVDLEGFGDRKPNELSGGQKQRVAIARALVKKPEIIMADEPSGALDSNTGKQIFDTLKKLSKDKLVIVVSHDREFAEIYADRIIELADGKVISDLEVDANPEITEEKGITFNQNTVQVPCGYHLTEQDRVAINEYIDSLKSEISIAVNEKSKGKKFKNTDQSKIKPQDSSKFKLIKSKLPLKNAFKIGANALKYKKFRLVITVLLSCIAFGLFGLADTFGSYNHIKTCTNSLVDSGVKYLSVAKSKKSQHGYWRDYGYYVSENDLKEITDGVGAKMHGVFNPVNSNLQFSEQINPEIKLTESEYNIYSPAFNGFAEISDSIVKEMGFKVLAGNLPDGTKNEIAVSKYVFEIFKKAQYFDGVTFTQQKDGSKTPVYIAVNNYSDLLGKTLTLNNVKYTVTAVIDTGFDLERYISLTEKKTHQTNAERMIDYALYSEFSSASAYSYTGIAMVGGEKLQQMIAERPPMTNVTEGYINFFNTNEKNPKEDFGVDMRYMAKLDDIKGENIIWLDGDRKTLGAKEFIATFDAFNFYENAPEREDYVKFLKERTNFDALESSDDGGYNTDGWKLVGIIDNVSEGNKSKLESTVITSDILFDKYTDGNDSVYGFAVGSMPKEKENVRSAVAYCYREDSNIRYQIQNSVTFELDSVNEALKIMSKYFFWIGVGFALFAAIMLSNFIATSISYKKQEIGILRAIGSRSNDVFRIFFSESFIIAMINFVLSAIGVFVATTVINALVRRELGILITVLSFTPRQIILLLAVSILVATVASFFPVKKIASKRPIDAIRNR